MEPLFSHVLGIYELRPAYHPCAALIMLKGASKDAEVSSLPPPAYASVNPTAAHGRVRCTLGVFSLLVLLGLAQYHGKGVANTRIRSSSVPRQSIYERSSFYHSVSRAESLCPSVVPGTPSHAGYIGLSGDSEEIPQRSFFWYAASRVASESPSSCTEPNLY